MSKLIAFLKNHYHYWGVPHRESEHGDKLVQVCYDCGATREVKAQI